MLRKELSIGALTLLLPRLKLIDVLIMTARARSTHSTQPELSLDLRASLLSVAFPFRFPFSSALLCVIKSRIETIFPFNFTQHTDYTLRATPPTHPT